MSEAKRTAWKQKLAQSRMALRSLLNTLTPEQWATTVYSEGDSWQISTIISHLIDAERGMSVQIHRTRKGEPSLPEGFDLNRWNAGVKKRMGDLSSGELLAALAETRAKTLEVMDSLQDEDWSRVGRHASRGEITVEQFYETIHGHELMHTADIKQALGLA